MARDCVGPEGAPEHFCPPQCRLRLGTTRERVDWAGLPVDLDLVFSRNQRDKVYLQHLLRRRDTQIACRFDDGRRRCARGDDCPLVRDEGLAQPRPTAGR
ncbi:hypothetical protein ACOJVU_08880 [Mycobacterium sp. THU-M104]|uniref:hypothetical protein n=1 Tax=Mycobacterium sp. THU-M104 TaxID=3410515 RepID=UPI003B9C3A8A